jgi:thiamine kinase-like enzyme
VTSPAGRPDLTQLIERVPAIRASVVGTLEGGITNRNVLVDLDGRRAVLRLPGRDTDLLGIDRATERVAATRAAALGFGPEVITYLEPEGCLVTAFVRGQPLDAPQVRQIDVLERLTAMVRSFHATAPLVHSFDAFRVPHEHRASAVARGVAVPATFERAAAVAGEIEEAFAASPDPRCPCHNDLLPANVLRGENGRLWLLDWEYAGTNDRYFDLGNLAVNNELDDDASDWLLQAYFGAVTPRRRARLALMKVMSDFREAMWGVVQQGISTLDFDYVSYADRHLDRLLTNAGRASLVRQLADATLPEEPPLA